MADGAPGGASCRHHGRGFTLIELMVAVSLVMIAATISIGGYRQFLDRAKRKVCESNLYSIGAILESYGARNDALPATLGEVPREDFEIGVARAGDRLGWRDRAIIALYRALKPREAHAQFLTYENLGGDPSVFSCPSDGERGVSYAINSALVGATWSSLGPGVVLVAESDSPVFDSVDDFEARHLEFLGLKREALALTRGGKIIEASGDSLDILVEELVTVCHQPDRMARTLLLPASSVAGHLAHGDHTGACSAGQ